MLRHVSLEERPIVVLGLRGGLLGANSIPHRSYIPYRDRRLSISEEALGAFGKSQTYSAEDRYRGRGYDKGQEAEQKQVEIMATTYCKEELERFKLCSGKVRLEDDKTLDIAGVGDVVLKTSFGTSWTLTDVRYIPGLKRMLISVGQLDEEGYHGIGAIINGSGSAALWHQRLGDMSRIGMSMLASKGKVLDVRKVDIYFCKPGGLGKQKNLSFIMSDPATMILLSKTVAGVAIQLVQPTKFNRIPYVLIGLRIPEEEWRGKDTSLTHLKVFGCDSFVKVKDVYREAMKCTFIGSSSDKVRYSFQDTKSHEVIRSRDITFMDLIYEASPGGSLDISEGSKTVEALRIVEDQMKNTLKTEHPARREALRLHRYEDPPESLGLR
ncbi:retrovirus-related pol polyprotein from transposon TNT 1-94, partial [Tanacetum coccineum]